MRKIYLTSNGLHEILEGQDNLIKEDWVKCELKEDGTPYSNYNIDGTPDLVKEQEDIDAKALANAKKAKESALANLTVATTSGKEFFADPESRTDLATVILEGYINNVSDDYQTEWKTVSRGDLPFEVVTFAELKEANRKALEAKAQIIGVTNV